MSIVKRTLSNSFFSMLSVILPGILFFLFTPYFIAKLGSVDYGVWVLINSTVGVLGVLNLGIGDALVKFISEYHSDDDDISINQVIRTSIFIYLVMGAVIASVSMLFSSYFTMFFNVPVDNSTNVTSSFRLSVIGFIINLFHINLVAIFKAYQRYDISSKIMMVTDVLRYSFMVLVLFLGYGIKEMVIGYILGSIIGLLVNIIYIRRINPTIKLLPQYNKEMMRKILSFTIHSFVIGLTGIVRMNIGIIIIGRLLGPQTVPYFSIPLQIANQILTLVGSVTTVMLPLFSSMKNDKALTRQTYWQASKLTAYLGLGIGTLVFIASFHIIELWISDDFANTSNMILKILIIGSTLTMLNAVAYFLLLGSGRIKYIAIYQVIAALSLLIFGPLLLNFFGLMGLAISYLFNNIIVTLIIYKGIQILWNDWLIRFVKIYYKPVIVALICIVIYSLLITPETTLFLAILLTLSCFLAFSILAVLIDRVFFQNLINGYRATDK